MTDRIVFRRALSSLDQAAAGLRDTRELLAREIRQARYQIEEARTEVARAERAVASAVAQPTADICPECGRAS